MIDPKNLRTTAAALEQHGIALRTDNVGEDGHWKLGSRRQRHLHFKMMGLARDLRDEAERMEQRAPARQA